VSGIADVEAGAFHSLARTSTGGVLAWGRNNSGQLGIGSTVTKLVPTAVAGLAGVVEIACGRDHSLAEWGDHSLAERGDHTVAAWGLTDAGQLGDGSTTNRATPVTVVGARSAVGMAVGRGYTMVLSTS
ncbi:MAG TPA: RCC1 repeat- and reductase domain-containing protein, partial [Frankiaceae bacterium]|nr:RCC1 repeat- and reductase domain-containing protein [Frankiaceae bacterium]